LGFILKWWDYKLSSIWNRVYNKVHANRTFIGLLAIVVIITIIIFIINAGSHLSPPVEKLIFSPINIIDGAISGGANISSISTNNMHNSSANNDGLNASVDKKESFLNNNINDVEKNMRANTFGIQVLFGSVAIIALLMSVLGLFITLLTIGTGNFRSQFYDTLIRLSTSKCIENNAECRSDLVSIKKLHGNIASSADGLAQSLFFIIIATIAVLIAVCLCIILQKFYITITWTLLWWMLLFYVLSLIFGVVATLKSFRKGISYPILSKMQKYLGDKAIKELELELEKTINDDLVISEELRKCNEKLMRIKAIIDED